MSYRRTNDGTAQEVEPSTAGASGAGDLEEEASEWEEWLFNSVRVTQWCIYCNRPAYEPGWGCHLCGMATWDDIKSAH